MFCTKCNDSHFTNGKTTLDITVNGKPHQLTGIDCSICSICGDVCFSHKQGLEIDKKRISLEFGEKETLSPNQLKWLRKLLDFNLDGICDVLNIGKNSYGRWERGEVEITPSMNILVHGLIDKFPGTKVNLFDYERNRAIDRVNIELLGKDISFGEYLREATTKTLIMSFVVCETIGLEEDYFTMIKNNDVKPERIPYKTTAKLARFFRLKISNLISLLDYALNIFETKSELNYAHARSISHGEASSKVQASSINKILEKLAEQKKVATKNLKVSSDYIKKVSSYLNELNDSSEVFA